MNDAWIMDKQACVCLMLHHHQPYLFEGGRRLSNVAKMWLADDDQQRWNVACYVGSYAELPRCVMGLAAEGLSPAVMADFSGSLLLGLEEAERDGLIAAMAAEKGGSRAAEVLGALREAVSRYPRRLELLATGLHHPLFHPAATPKADWALQLDAYLDLHRRLFGAAPTGFWPPEMAVPGSPEDIYNLIELLLAREVRYLLLPSVPYKDDWNERALRPAQGEEGFHSRFFLPHVLRGRKEGSENWIVTLARDPRAEPQKGMSFEGRGMDAAQGVARELAARGEKLRYPPLVTACSDGDNGDNMMQGRFLESAFAGFVRSRPEQQGPIGLVTATQYLEAVLEAHFGRADWARAPELVPEVVIQPEGYSWSGGLGNIWLNRPEKRELYQEVARLSVAFHAARRTRQNEAHWGEALEAVLLCETSCYTWWEGGYWLEQAAEAMRRAWAAMRRLGA